MSTRWMTSEEEKKRVTLPAGTTWDDVEVTRRILRKPAWLPGGALVQPLPKKPRGGRGKKAADGREPVDGMILTPGSDPLPCRVELL